MGHPGRGVTGTGASSERATALLLSPFIEPGSIDKTPYNHYSLLRSLEDIFGLAHLGYAASPNPGTFEAVVH